MLFVWDVSSQEWFGVAGCPCWAHHGFAKEKEPLGLCKLTEEILSDVNGSAVIPGCFLKVGFWFCGFFVIHDCQQYGLPFQPPIRPFAGKHPCSVCNHCSHTHCSAPGEDLQTSSCP